MNHPCDTCSWALPDHFCTKHYSRSDCADFRNYAQLQERNRRLERRLEYLGWLVHRKLALKRKG